MSRVGVAVKQIDLLQTKEPGKCVDSCFLLLRQTQWGQNNNEVRLEFRIVEEDGSAYCVGVGIASGVELLSLAHAALVLAGKQAIAEQIEIPNRPSAVARKSKEEQDGEESD